MNSIILFIIVVSIIALLLLTINFLLASHKPYKEKKTPFECGYHSFLAQSRTPFNIIFFVFALLFLLFDIEIVIIYPFTASIYFNSSFGLTVVLVFIFILGLGFLFELGKNVLKIETKQTRNL